MKKGDKIGIVACSNGLKESSRPEMEQLKITLESLGLMPFFSEYLYAKNGAESGTRQQRAEALMKFYRDEEIKGIFDVSGGDLANGVLPWLDYEVIAKSGKVFWGYSDLTTVVNAITAKTGNSSVLYQIRNLIYQDGEEQKRMFRNCLLKQNQGQKTGSTQSQYILKQNQDQEDKSLKSQSLPESLETEESGHIQKMSGLDTLFHFPYHFLQGTHMSGPLIGGNIRCFLKLAGTEYFPDLTGKLLLMEACGGGEAQLLTYLSHLEQLGAFRKVSGILLGTFTKLDREKGPERVWELLQSFVPAELPVARTTFIGHGTDSRAAVIGSSYNFSEK